MSNNEKKYFKNQNKAQNRLRKDNYADISSHQLRGNIQRFYTAGACIVLSS